MYKLRLSTGVLAFSGMLLAAGTVQPARASCGATFCSVNTQWETQGAWTEPGLRLNLRYEYTDQDQLRSGADKVEPGGVPGTHDEIRTLNRNLQVGMDYAFNPAWAIFNTSWAKVMSPVYQWATNGGLVSESHWKRLSSK